MKKKTINYTSPDIKEVDVRVRSVIALSGSTENYGYESGYVDDEPSAGSESYGTIDGEW